MLSNWAKVVQLASNQNRIQTHVYLTQRSMCFSAQQATPGIKMKWEVKGPFTVPRCCQRLCTYTMGIHKNQLILTS